MNDRIRQIHEYVRNARRGIQANATTHLSRTRYERMPRISLTKPTALNTSLDESLSKRASAKSFEPGKHLSLEKLSSLLGHAIAERADNHRPYPSGGGLYPVETYVIARTARGLDAGVYYYDAATHALAHLWNLPVDFEVRRVMTSDLSAEFASCIIVHTARWNKTTLKYKDFGYLLSLLEAGHMCQNLLLVASALDLSIRPYAGFDEVAMNQLLDLQNGLEDVLYVSAISA